MDEHPGDTLGKRFLTFWGALAAIAAVAILLGLYRWIALPSDTADNDGGAGTKRLDILQAVSSEQEKELITVAEVTPGQTVRIPPTKAVPWAVSVLAAHKATPSAIKTTATLAREAAANPPPPPAPASGASAPAPGAPATPAPGNK
jgi:hypothetical protein